MSYHPVTYCKGCGNPFDVWTDKSFCQSCEEIMERAELGVDGNAGFALLGPDLQEGEAEFVTIDLPIEASKDPNRYHHSEWVSAARRAATKAYRNLKARLPDREFSYYLCSSHPDHLA